MTSPVSEIKLILANFPFRTMDYIVHGGRKLNRLESAQKIHASRG